MTDELVKYPRTAHIQGSRRQPGDEGLGDVPFEILAGKHLVVEEKVDGANAAVSFGSDGRLRLQSRGHYLVGGRRERHFDLFKQWATARADALREVLGDEHIMFGEWLYAKHTIFYDALPHYFLEFDLFHKPTKTFLDTPRRHRLLQDAPVCSVRVVKIGTAERAAELGALVGPSAFMTDVRRDRLGQLAQRQSLDTERVLRETDLSGTMEGLYIKVEEGGQTVGRYKLIRPTFLTTVIDSESHWLDRPIIANQLAPGADIFS